MTETIRPIISKNLVAVTAMTSVEEALAVMDEHRFRHLPVTDPASGGIIGMVSRRDLENRALDAQLPVLTALNGPLVTALASDSLRQVILRLLEKKISSVLVIDAEENALGIVTTDDILWHYASALEKTDVTVQPLLSFENLRLAGAVANQLSNAGI